MKFISKRLSEPAQAQSGYSVYLGNQQLTGQVTLPDGGFFVKFHNFAAKSRSMLKHLLFIWLLLWATYGTGQSNTGTITVAVAGLSGDEGQAIGYLYKTATGFPVDPKKASSSTMVAISGKKAVLVFSGLEYGTYAVSVIHDSNGNDEVDTNWIGMPTEGVGVSNDAKGFFGPPKFKDASFALSTPDKKIAITMVY